MRLRNRFILFAVFIHSIMALIAYFLLQYNTAFFLVAEGLIIVSVFITAGLYRTFLKPLNILAAGLESLKEKDFSVKFVKMGQFEIDQLIDVYNKMIDQLREERIEVNEQHSFLEKLIKASPSGILILDYENRIKSINPAAQQFLGLTLETLLDKKLKEISHPLMIQLENLSPRASSIIQGSGSKTYKCHKANFVHKGFHQHFILMEELTAEILKAEKKAYEKVIRMMSHEINNSVGAVNSMLDTVKRTRFVDDAEYDEVLQVCMDRSRRMSKFMSNFADVVRLPEVKKEKHDLHVLLKEITILFSGSCKEKNIALKTDFSAEEFILIYDEQQIEQALINIIKNAVESIGNEGEIKIITRSNPRQLIIRDTGAGIAPEVALKLFSPFFSTKKEGQGIGLTLTKEILYKHNFNFSLETKPQGYTDFTIDFS